MNKPTKILLGIAMGYVVWRFFIKKNKNTQNQTSKQIQSQANTPDTIENKEPKKDVLTDQQIFKIADEFRVLQHGKSSYEILVSLLKDVSQDDFERIVERIKTEGFIDHRKGFTSFSQMVQISDNELYKYLKERFPNFI